MPAYRRVNLFEVEDTVSSRIDGIEGRFARKHLESRDLGVSLVRYAPDFRAETGHKHREQEEAYIVVSGTGRMLVNDEVIQLRPWDVVRVAPAAARAFATGPEGLEIIAVGGPKPEGGDGEAAPAVWPEAGAGD